MTLLVPAELLKLATTRAWIGFVLATLALTGIATAGTMGSSRRTEIGTSELSHEIVSNSLFGALIAFIVGIVCVTSEWRHGTITRTFLGTPRRERVLLAKELAVVAVAGALAAFAILVALATALPWLAVVDSSFEPSGDIVLLVVQILAATALWGALGVGVGAVVRSQTVALVGSILWILVAEALLQALLGLVGLESVADYLPGRALSAFDETVDDGLAVWAGGLVGVAWVVGLGALGAVSMNRRDVT